MPSRGGMPPHLSGVGGPPTRRVWQARALSAKHRSGCWSCAVPAVTVVVVRAVPWWGVVSSAAAPVLMVAGWTVAAGLQPRSFDPVAQPVSVLAAPGAADRSAVGHARAVWSAS